jgi:histidine triad (HIT) family protein
MNKFSEDCTFCRIALNKEDPAIVFQDDVSLGFLDNRPLFAGHTLLIPKDHYQTFSDLPKELISELFSKAQLIDRAVRAAMNAEGSFIGANNKISQSIPHFHIHIVPRNHKDGLRGFFWPRTSYSSEENKNNVVKKIKIELKHLSNHHLIT